MAYSVSQNYYFTEVQLFVRILYLFEGFKSLYLERLLILLLTLLPSELVVFIKRFILRVASFE